MRALLSRNAAALALVAVLQAAAASAPTSVWAEPSAGQILTDLTVGGSDRCVEVRVSFSLPIRMIKHFPEDFT